ncbi:hypothetical protein D3C76_994590 [compost metagenome]
MAADWPALGRGHRLAEHPADPYRVHSAAGAAASVCADQAATGPSTDRLRHDLRPDHALHVPAGGLRQHLPQRDPAGQRRPQRCGHQRHQRDPRHGHSGPGHGGGPADRVCQLPQEACLRPGEDRTGRASGGAIQPAEPDGGRRGHRGGVHHSVVARFDDHRCAGRLPDLLGVGHCQMA